MLAQEGIDLSKVDRPIGLNSDPYFLKSGGAGDAASGSILNLRKSLQNFLDPRTGNFDAAAVDYVGAAAGEAQNALSTERAYITWIEPPVSNTGNLVRLGSLNIFHQLRRAVANEPLGIDRQWLTVFIDDLEFGRGQSNCTRPVREHVERRQGSDSGFC